MSSTHLAWYVARAGGITAWIAAGLAVVCGVLLGTRALGKKAGAPYLTALHRHFAFITVAATVLHLIALICDNYTHFTILDMVLPGHSAWKPIPITLGVLALWLLAAVQCSSLAMRHLPRRWWRVIHLSSYAMFGLSGLHAVLAGTDLKTTGARLAALGGTAFVIFFTAYRITCPNRHQALAEARAKKVVPDRES